MIQCGTKRIGQLLACVLALSLFALTAVLAEETGDGKRFVRGEARTYDLELAADSGDLLQAYVDELSGLRRGEAPRNASIRLQGIDAAFYHALKPLFRQVADGQLSSTSFSLTFADLGLPTTITAEELGVSVIASNDTIFEDASNAIAAYIYPNVTLVLNALLIDCPYALYWYDKTKGVSIVGPGYYHDDNTIYFSESDSFVYSFPVAAEYALGPYEFDTSVAETVQSAVAEAARIVSSHADDSDYEKLTGYKEDICRLTSYNFTAANGSVHYGNPWQLIWVFDNKPSTAVVCEGYAKAFQYLCDMTRFSGNVSVRTVYGTMNDGGHMWNLVTMPNGKTYLADITNCDSGMVGEKDLLFMAGYYSRTSENRFLFQCRGRSGYTYMAYVYDENIWRLFSAEELTISNVKYLQDDQTAVALGVSGDWIYDESDSGCEITKYNGPGGDVVVPAEIDGLAVTAIGAQAFAECEALTSVTIPDTVASIGDYAFAGCLALTNVTLSESVESVGTGALPAEGYQLTVRCAARRGRFSDCALTHDPLTPEERPATCTEPGLVDEVTCARCARTLSEPVELAPLGHDWGEALYTWAEDWSSVTAAHVCLRDAEHVESETARTSVVLARRPTETSEGMTGYVALFTQDGFSIQVEVLQDIPALSSPEMMKLPASLATIDEEAFAGVPCVGIVIPNDCVAVGPGAFSGCASLIYVKVSRRTVIADDAFDDVSIIRFDYTD